MQSAWVRLHPSAVHNYQYDGIAALQMRPRSQLEAQHPKSPAKIQICPLLALSGLMHCNKQHPYSITSSTPTSSVSVYTAAAGRHLCALAVCFHVNIGV